MCDKMTISAYILKILEKDPFLRLQMRTKEMFNRHQFFSTNKQYVKIKLVQNETNMWSIFYGKNEIKGSEQSQYKEQFVHLHFNF